MPTWWLRQLILVKEPVEEGTPYNNTSAASAHFVRSGVHGALPGTFAAERGSAGGPAGERWRRVGTL